MQGLLKADQLLLDVLGDHPLDDDSRLVQHGAADGDAGRELHAVDPQGSRPIPSTCWTSLGLTTWLAETSSASTMAMVCSVSTSSSSYCRRVRFWTTSTPSTRPARTIGTPASEW